jgi:hypothetical protein
MTGLRGTALAQAVIDTVTTHPELHDQGVSLCGGEGCLVGWTVALAEGYGPGDSNLEAALYDSGTYYREVRSRLVEANEVDVAAELLGLKRSHVSYVFGLPDEQEAIAEFARLTGAQLPEDVPGGD